MVKRPRRVIWLGTVALGIVAVALVVRRELALCPHLGDAGTTGPVFKTQSPLAPIAFQCDGESCWKTSAAPTQDGGGSASRFSSGQVDLTGDGLPETVRLSDHTATISQDGNEVWRSPAGWTVVDAALGDPNRDGRYELLLAFWRDDAEGVPRSQPFIIGYRLGQYRILWGGSPITEPILGVALGDVDGDGEDDLIVLEAATGADPNVPAASTVAVWRWHGWGFSNMWRSPTGTYRDLILVPGTEDAPDAILVMASAR